MKRHAIARRDCERPLNDAKIGSKAMDGEVATGGIASSDGRATTSASIESPSRAPRVGNAGVAQRLEQIRDVAHLESALSEPSDELVQSLSQLDGDILVLGAGGKMGPSVARMARRGLDAAGAKGRVFAASRFSNLQVAADLIGNGVECIEGNLLQRDFLKSLPNAANIIHLVGMKFGSAGDAAHAWAVNAYLAGLVAERFCGARIVALSTGNVYGLSPLATSRGPAEDADVGPVGEYAMSALGRERLFQHFSKIGRSPTVIVRLNYAVELRYGVLVDLALKVHRGEPIPLEMGHFNAIWQRDACDMILRSLTLAASPPLMLNVTGTDTLSCRSVCERFGELFDRKPTFIGRESPQALLSDASLAAMLLGPPRTSVGEMIDRIADWIGRDGETWNKPTKFEVRDGVF